MLNINIQIDNADFESALAKRITLSDGDDLSKEITNLFLSQLKEMAGHGIEKQAEEQVKEAIQTATEQKKQDFEVLIESVNVKVK
jgi:hypothetical protein